jgi:hypothetical protein
MSDNRQLKLARRAFLKGGGMGLGFLGLSSLFHPGLLRAGQIESEKNPGAFRALHFPARAKRVIFLYMSGGPSQFETFDNKPELKWRAGQEMPESLTRGHPLAQLQGASKLTCFAPLFSFSRHGKSGQEISSLLPETAKIADDITIIRSLRTDAINHDPAHTLLNTGSPIPGRASMGSWVYYGLGAQTENLPGFVLLTSTGQSTPASPFPARTAQNGFLPAQFQGVPLKSAAEPISFLGNPRGISSTQQEQVINAVASLDALNPYSPDSAELSATVNEYEMAFKMQTSVPELNDFAKESPPTLASYGVERADGSFGANCLLARRLAERGVRFIQVIHRDWDHHQAIERNIVLSASEVDRGCAALIKDLKSRGMLKDTLVIWAGEFGRTPMAQKDGRDHHIRAFSIWMAGAGVKAGFTYGKTDDFGYNVVENPLHVNDLHATMLYLLGIDHTKLTFRWQGRDMRLTDVSGQVAHEILA